MPVHLVYGDGFLVSRALRELRQQVGPPEVVEPNYHHISGADANLANLRPVCDAVPFLAEMRLVVVEGALGSADQRGSTGSRGRGRTSPAWNGLEDYLKGLPPPPSPRKEMMPPRWRRLPLIRIRVLSGGRPRRLAACLPVPLWAPRPRNL